jgi:hypothetical protein
MPAKNPKINELKYRYDHVRVGADGVVTVRRGYFYRNGRTADDIVGDIVALFPGAVILEAVDVWKPFNGGAPLRRQSHFLVRFRTGE